MRRAAVPWLLLAAVAAGCDAPMAIDRPSPSGITIATVAPSAGPLALSPGDVCSIMNGSHVSEVFASAIDGLAKTTAADPWSRAAVGVAIGGSASSRVTIEVAWQGTLVSYGSLDGAEPVPDLADEAYRFDRGRQIALRSGEVVAVITWALDPSDVPFPGTEPFARVAAHLLEPERATDPSTGPLEVTLAPAPSTVC